MKIFCFGDSNTWGYNPADGSRFPRPWPAVLQELRSTDEVTADGVCGRATKGDTSAISNTDGEKVFFRKYVHSDFQADCLIFMIGTNDLSVFFPTRTPEEISGNIRHWIRAFRQKKTGDRTSFLVLSPVQLNQSCLTHPLFGPCFDRSSLEKSARLTEALQKMSQEEQVLFLDADTVAHASGIDGIHMEAPGHVRLAAAIDRILP